MVWEQWSSYSDCFNDLFYSLLVWLYTLVVAIGVVGNAVSLWVLLLQGVRRTSACR